MCIKFTRKGVAHPGYRGRAGPLDICDFHVKGKGRMPVCHDGKRRREYPRSWMRGGIIHRHSHSHSQLHTCGCPCSWCAPYPHTVDSLQSTALNHLLLYSLPHLVLLQATLSISCFHYGALAAHALPIPTAIHHYIKPCTQN